MLVIPSQVVRANVSHWKSFIPESAVIISSRNRNRHE